ncbi:pectate lyase [Flagelloscypha sp. PMI_526]|nr:pectate lyase [Flagelloscypha sp. PMI_526]
MLVHMLQRRGKDGAMYFLLLPALWIGVSALRIRLNPTGISTPRPDPDYTLWTVPQTSSATATFDDVILTLSVPDNSILKGSQYKLIYTRIVAYYGERTVGEGISTNTTTGEPITLTIKGLAAGNHTLLSFHNAWDKLPATTNIDIALDGCQDYWGTKFCSPMAYLSADHVSRILPKQFGRIAFGQRHLHTFILLPTLPEQEVKVTYTPLSSDVSTDLRAFLNGLELDTPDVSTQATFPYPEHTNEHADAENAKIIATWTPPKLGTAPLYDVYFGKNGTELPLIGSRLAENSYTFQGIEGMGIYAWRVDVRSGSEVITGRTWTWRPRQLAFPGAEGYGRFARGGRGGKVVKVTTLDDYDPATATPIPGTLRYALTVETDLGPLCLIVLISRLAISQNYITIAGETAPGKGIAIMGWPMGLSGATDVIVRHMRVRPGNISNQTIDGMGAQGSNFAIFDRCSMGWASDECFSSRSAYNITFQRSIISEPLNFAYHKNYPPGFYHGYAASISGNIGTFHHNLIAHAYGRSWSMAGGADADGNFDGRLDLRNNVVYNYGMAYTSRLIFISSVQGYRVTEGGAHQVNFVNNWYQPGPSSLVHHDLMAQYEDGLPGTQTYYCAGNTMPGWVDENSPQVFEPTDYHNAVGGACWANVSISPAPTYQKFFDEPFWESYVETHSSREAYKRVLSDSGARSPIQDDHDKRIVNETLTNTTTYVGSRSGLLGIIDTQDDVGGLEEFPEVHRDAAWDADGDGIADWWDGSTGGGWGYTPMDGYLNFLSEPHLFVKPRSKVTVDLLSLAIGFVNPTFNIVSQSKRGNVSLRGSVAIYTAGGACIDRFSFVIQDSEGSSWTREIGVAVFDSA